MATVIQLKNSSTAGDVPAVSDLVAGELAVNTYDGKLFLEKNDGSAAIVEIGSNPSTLSVNSAYSFPTSDGASSQILQTDGSGSLTFVNAPSSGISTFTYSVTSTQTVFSGSDDNGATLAYTVGIEQVFLNGIKLIVGDDYARTNSGTITLQANAESGDVLEVVAQASISNLVQGFFTTVEMTATTSDQVLSGNAVANKAVKYVIMASHATAGTHAAEVLLINDGSNAYFVQYGDAYSGSSLFSLSSDISGGNMRLLATPANTNTTFKTFQIRLT
jgi:hypothetical protein